MERTIVKVIIPYFENGVDKEKKFTVSRISRKVIKEYTEIILHLTEMRDQAVKLANKARDRKRQIDNIVSNASDLIGKKITVKESREAGSKAKEKIVVLDKEIKVIEAEIKELEERDIAAECMTVVSRILKDNGIEDPQMIDVDFWEECTEEADLWQFLSSVVYKDVQEQSKKKVM